MKVRIESGDSLKPKSRIILVSSLTVLGLGMIGSGAYLELTTKQENTNIENVNPDIPLEQELTLTLKDITLPVNSALNLDVQNYIEEPVAANILQNLILDTTKVDVSTVGTYEYTITYKDQTFTGNITIQEEIVEETPTEPVTQSDIKLTLNTISLKLGESLPTDLSYYVSETLSDDIKQQMKLDTSDVIVNKAGSYQYTITYNGMYYTGTITITEDQPIRNNKQEETEEEQAKEETDDNEQANQTDDSNTQKQG